MCVWTGHTVLQRVKAPVLRYYDLNKEITTQWDARKVEIDLLVIPKGKPIIHVSRNLNKTEQNAHIEKKCLIIVLSDE